MYGDTNENLCYVGLNTPSLQLINISGGKVKDLKKNDTIKAYMENGEECTNLTSEKIGTYKLRYDYTKDDKSLTSDGVNKKSAERTITVKPSKPVINKFEVIKDNNAIYNPTIIYNVSDSSKKTDMELKYCINVTGKISDCNNWSNAKNSQDSSLKINLNDLDKNVSGKNSVNVYLFVKNGFEEYTYKSQNYKIRPKITIKLNGGKYGNSTSDFTKYVNNGTKLGSTITLNSFTRDNHIFEGLKNPSGTSYTADTVITDDVTLTAQWYKYCTNRTLKSTSCSKSCGGGNIIKKYHDSKYTDVSCGEETTSTTCNTDKCYTRCDETTTKKVCEKNCPSANDCWPIQYHYYKYDIKDNSLCESWWSGESCSLSGESSTTDCPYGYKTYGPTMTYDNARWYCPECNGYRWYCWNNYQSCQCRCGC